MPPIFPQATSEPLSPERLAEIAERAAHLYEYALQTDEGDTLAGEDVPALLAEIERLRARNAELEARIEHRAARLVALENDALAMRGLLSPSGRPARVPMELGESLVPAVEWLLGRVAELERPAAVGPRCYHGDVIGSGDCPGCDNEAATFREGWQR